MTISKRCDDIDRIIRTFNTNASNLRLIGSTTKYKEELGGQLQLLSFSPHASSLQDMLNCSIKNDVKPLLTRLKELTRRKCAAVDGMFKKKKLIYTNVKMLKML